MRAAVEAFGLTPVEKAGYEADDLIGTYALQARDAGAEVLLISSDKDLMQLVSDKVLFYDFESGAKGKPGYRPERKIDRDGVIEYFGVPPEKVIDVQALVGDTSDNVPGVPGIGVKTASALIAEYGDLETLLARAPEIKQPKRRELLLGFAEQARLSKKLVTLDCSVEVEVPLATLRVPEIDAQKLIAFTKAMELFTLTKRVGEATGVDPRTIEADPKLKSAKAPVEKPLEEGDLPTRPVLRPYFNAQMGGPPPTPAVVGEPSARAAQGAAAAMAVPIDTKS